MPEYQGVKWWVYQVRPDADGGFEVKAQYDTGAGLTLHVPDGVDVDHAIAAGVEADLRRDRRWTKRSERS